MAVWIATAAFGLEGLVKQELKALGIEGRAEPGGVLFEADDRSAFLANLHLRCADRVLLLLKQGEARTYEELFELVKALPWADYLPRDARFPVSGHCARSQLMSVRDCQAIAKKAIVERLKQSYKESWFAESGETYQVAVTLHADRVRVTLDASGEALNRRGYRTWTGEAPLRETLAAALVALAPWRPGEPLHDPCCGTGTILIEAAFRMAHRAPGLKRGFAMERWQFVDQAAFAKLRREAEAAFRPELVEGISGSDVDPEALKLCQRHIAQAGLSGRITVFEKDLRDLSPFERKTCIISNLPYGERMMTKGQTEALYRSMRGLEQKNLGGPICVLAANPAFERLYGRRAAYKRRLYNGRLECEYLVFREAATRS